MRVMTIVWILIVALPLSAQTETERPVPFDDIVYVETIPTLGRIPILGYLFQDGRITSPAPNSHAQVQQVIDKMMWGARETVVIDVDSVLLANAAKSRDSPFDSQTQKLIGGLKSIQIRGFEVEGAVGASLTAYRSKVQPIRDLLKAPLWVRYAANTSRDSELEIWSGRSGNTPTGVILLSITGGKQVFIMNVAGEIRPDQLIYLSGVLGIPSFNLGLGQH